MKYIVCIFFFLVLSTVLPTIIIAQCSDSYEPNNSTATATPLFSPPLGSSSKSVTIYSQKRYDDQDWYLVGIDGPGILTITLSNLPSDYDMELYGLNGLSEFISGSYNTGTTSETIVSSFLSLASTARYIKVYGKALANYSNTSCYTLTVSWEPCTIYNTTPVLSSPGTSSSPGQTVSTLTPTLDWNDVQGASKYGVYIRDVGSNTLVYDNNCASTSSQLIVPSGILENNKTYRWNVRAYTNCNSNNCVSLYSSVLYFTTSVSSNTCTRPTQPSTGITFSNISSNQVTVNWNKGGGSKQVVKINTSSTFTDVSDGTDPSSNSAYQNGTNQVVYNGTGTSVTVTGLQANTTYFFKVFDGNCTGSSSLYYNAGGSNNPNSVVTSNTNQCTAPSITSNPQIGTVCQSQTASVSVGASGTNLQYQWQQLNNSTYTDVSGKTDYYLNTTTAGTYRCRVYNSCGTTYSNSVTIQFTSCTGPVANFSVNTPNLIAGQSTTLTDKSTNNPTTWSWSIEQEQVTASTGVYKTSSQTSPTITFTKPGCFKVTLTVSNSTGTNSNTQYCAVYVKPNLSTKIPESVARAADYPTAHGGDPVDVATGAFVFSMKDLSVFNCFGEIALDRRYNSRNTEVGTFGKGWSAMTDIRLDVSDPYQWTLHHADGHVTVYIPYQNGETRSLYNGSNDSLYYTNTSGIFTYTYVRRDGTKFNFRSDGLLDYIVDLNGNKIQYAYSGTSLSSIVAPGSKYINFSTNATGRITASSDGSGRIVEYFYNIDASLLDSVRVRFGSSIFTTTSFVYDNTGMAQIIDGMGNRVIKNVYDPVSRKVVSQYDPYDSSTTFVYDTIARKTIVTNPRGNFRTYSYDSSYRLIGLINELGYSTRFTYTAQNLLDTAINERGFLTRFVYDSAQNPITVVDTKGYFDTIGYTAFNRLRYWKDANGNTTTLTQDANANPIAISLPGSGTIHKYYDSHGLDTLIVDARNNSIKKQFTSGFDLASIATIQGVSKLAYDVIGRPIAMTNGKGLTDSIQYNGFNQVTKVIDPTGAFVTYAYDKNGNKLTETDKEGNTTAYVYDKKDRLTAKIEPYNHTTQFVYDALDRVIKRRDANRNTLLFAYDAANRLLSVSDSVSGILATYQYDSTGNRIAISDANGKTWRFRYDERNLPIAYINPLNDSVTISYDKNRQIVSVANQLGSITRYEYDSAGRVTTVTDPLNNVVRAYYNANGLMDSLRDAKRNLRVWTYTATNKINTFNDGYGDYRYTWDSAGYLSSFADVDNNKFDYTHDPNGNLIAIAINAIPYRSFTRSKNGWITTAKIGTDSMRLIRNPLGWVTQAISQFSDTATYVYDSVGNVSKLSYKGKDVRYSYNSLNKSISVTDWNNKTYTIWRNKIGTIDSITYPNGFRTTVSRDDAAQVRTWKLFGKTTDTAFHANYITREKTGWVLSDSGRKVLSPFITYSTASGSYDIDDRLTAFGSQSIQNSDNGNRTSAISENDTSLYKYNPDGTIAFLQHHGYTDSMMYDPFGMRIRRITANASSHQLLDYVVSNRPLALAQTNDTTKAATDYIYTPEGMLLAQDSVGQVRYFHYDAYGNTVALSNDSSQLTDTYAYGVFGDFFTHKGTSTQPFTFLGTYGIQKEASDLYYIWNRYYDANTGRFLSKDPYPYDLSSTQGVNPYVYGNNNPSLFVDVNGLYSANTTSSDDMNWFEKFANSKAGSLTVSILERIVAEYKTIFNTWDNSNFCDNCLTNQYSEKNVSLEQFRKKFLDKSFSDFFDGKPLYPNFLGKDIYNKIDTPYNFIDMGNGKELDVIHFLNVGQYGYFIGGILGTANEVQQLFQWENSAFYPQDLYSNELGFEFFSKYQKKLKQNPTMLAEYMYEFLSTKK